jgi:hypothetical protein
MDLEVELGMDILNRTLVTLVPKEAFLAWVRSLGEDCEALKESDLMQDCNAYLVPEIDSEEELESYFSGQFQRFFEAELADWTEDASQWPELSYSMFQEFFDVHVQTVVYDMDGSPLEKEAY